jgi:hypothetical protein
MAPEPVAEVLTDGRGEPITEQAQVWLRRHRIVAVLLILAAVAAAAVLAVRSMQRPGLPRLDVLGDADSAPAADPWQSGWDGRPRGPVVFAATIVVRRPDPGREDLRVVGITGPGVVRDDTAQVAVPARTPTLVPVRAVIDCGRLATDPPGAYRLEITAGQGQRRRGGTVPTGRPGQGWADAVQLACATFTARRDLTVSTVTARVHPTLPRADLVLTVVNAGPREAVVTAPDTATSFVTTQGLFPVRVAPTSSVSLRITVALDRCDVVGTLQYDAGSPALTDRIGLVATIGRVPSGGARFDSPGEGTRPTGVVLTAAAGRTLGAALWQACGGLGPIAVLIPKGGVHFTEATRDLAVTALIDVTPGRVSAMSLQPDTTQFGDAYSAFPTWTTTPDLRPDRSGETKVTLHYRTPGSRPCSSLGATLMGAVATMHVPGPTGERVVRYSLFLDMAQDSAALPQLCGS